MRVAITQRIVKNSNGEIRECLDIRWGELFKEVGFEMVVLPYMMDFKKFNFNGVILSGGNNIGECLLRDNYEMDLIDFCVNKNIPILGVCRGMQIIGKYFGGELKKESQVGIYHTLNLNLNSIYYKFLNKIDKVNAYHNYVLEKVPFLFKLSATDEKGTIKAMEHIKFKIFAHMWHPEREIPFSTSQLELIKGFFK